MIIKTTFNIGGVSYEFNIDEKDEMDALHKAIALSNPRTYCAACSTNIAPEDMKMTTNKDKEGNTYVNLKHRCGARSKLGQYKTGGYFWHDFEKYVPKTEPEKTVKDPTDLF